MSASQEPARGWIRRLSGQVWKHKRDVQISFVAAVLSSAGQAMVPLIARTIVDDVIGDPTQPLWPWLLLMVVIAIAVFGLAYLRRYHNGRSSLAVQYDLRNQLHDHLLTLDQRTLSHLSTGQLVSRASSDTTLILGLLNFLPLMFGNLLLMLMSLAIMFWLSPLLACIGLVIAPALFVVSYRLRVKVFPASWDGQQREGEVAEIVDEDVGGVRVVKAFGQEERELQRMVGVVRTLYGSRMRATRLQARYQPLLEAIPTLAQVAVLALGGWLVLEGNITIGTFLAFSTYVTQFVAPARQLAGVLTIGQQARAGVERIFQVLDLETAIEDRPDAVELPELRGEIELRDVHFGYDEAEVLRGLDLHIAAGERVALVGSSGSGKSTVVDLVQRMLDPDRGPGARRRPRRTRRDPRLAPRADRGGVRGELPLLRHASPPTSPTADPTRAATRSRRRPASPAPTTSSASCPTATTRRSASAGSASPAASGSASPWPARSSSDPRVLLLDDATSAVDSSTEEAIFAGLREVLAGRTALDRRPPGLHAPPRRPGRPPRRGTGRRRRHARRADGPEHGVPRAVDRARRGRSRVGRRLDRDAHRARRDAGGVAERQPRGRRTRRRRAPCREGAADGRPRPRDARRRLAAGPGPHAGAASPGRGAATGARPPRARPREGVQTRPDLLDARTGLGVPLALRPRAATGRARRPGRRCSGRGWCSKGIDDGVQVHAPTVLWWTSAAFLVVVLVDFLDQVAETFVTGRTSERDHGRAADPDLGAAPAALPRLLRARDGRPDR